MAKRPESPNQLMMLGITPDAPRPASLDDVAFFDGHEVRMIHLNGETWWVLADLARAMGYRDATAAGRTLRDKHRGTHSTCTPGGRQEMVTVNEPGLYHLMMRSDKPEAERFQDWVTEEVLPAIRKYGFYSATPRLARTMRRLNCDPATADTRHRMTGGYKAFCSVLARHGAKPIHYGRAANSIYAAIYAGRDAKDLRKVIGLRSSATPMDHMSRFALDVQLAVTSLVERCLEERREAGDPVTLADQPEFIRGKVAEAVDTLLAIVGPGGCLGVVEDARRGRLLDITQKQIGGQN